METNHLAAHTKDPPRGEAAVGGGGVKGGEGKRKGGISIPSSCSRASPHPHHPMSPLPIPNLPSRRGRQPTPPRQLCTPPAGPCLAPPKDEKNLPVRAIDMLPPPP
ncbi:hypothetical protein E2C01_095942 [Portunus trituberculatus]|uniref:Uncharacterized protein n=1 Tax=Portunus trituberculatus TaxID=210409 RepID=A0A5B7K5L1_PORTR|nr:hypothetical protein [Portunus trituberculatus]